jgi:hypothetical protein
MTAYTNIFKEHPVFMFKSKTYFSLVILALVLLTFTTGCAREGKAESNPFPMASLNQMPPEVQNAPTTVRQSYQFAVANPEVLKALPCYCGCGPIGHESNYACYIHETETGEQLFDPHALGCSICVDITVDAMRMLGQGRTIEEIRTYVDDTYSIFGPTNMP